jgi:transcriptional regulator with XRE-family HTH domain
MNLAKLRNLRGLKQDQLAELIGVTQPTIHRAEAMDKSAKLSTYIACADALGVTLAEIFADDRDPVEQQVLQAVRRLGPVGQRRALALLELAEAHLHEDDPEKT